MGLYYAMDRDHRWERTELAWRTYVLGKGQRAQSAESAICGAYASGETDEFIRPILLPGFQAMKDKDQVICFNFRKDRPRQIIDALCMKDFKGFDRGDTPRPSITCMMPYNKNWNLPYAFEPERPETCLSEVISDNGLRQFHCSETEKYPHVTYFFNGGHNEPFEGETQQLIPSPKVATYDLKPEMSAPEVADAVIKALDSKEYAFTIVNFANGDMVGHTALPEAVIKAVETLDVVVGKVVDTAIANDYSIILTADHGNCEEMVDTVTGLPHTQHTTYPVPCMIIDSSAWQLSCSGGLSNIAATVLQLMGLEIPEEMTSKSLLIREVKSLIHANSMDSVA
jgi:2,3-bisphosphoglycerate-independent phosphoglycerate mutase